MGQNRINSDDLDAAPSAEPIGIGTRLRALREDRSVSLRDVAELIGCSAKHLWSVETGAVQRPRDILLVRLADYYEVSLDELFGRQAADRCSLLPLRLRENWTQLPHTIRSDLLTLIEHLVESPR